MTDQSVPPLSEAEAYGEQLAHVSESPASLPHSMRHLPESHSVMKRLARPFFYLMSLLVTGVVLAAIAIIVVFHLFSQDLPDSGKLAKYQPAGMTRLYAEDGSLIAEYAKERRIFVPFREIPKKVVNAFIAAEDQNFYSHRGIDPMGILRAVIANLRNYGTGTHSLVGGSTITQQVVKNFLLTREKSYERKIKEAILALRITQTYSKEKILELYLNQIYLGMGAYGVVAASDEYFGKHVSELETEEVALLAAMPKAPAYYDPRKRPDEALQRRNYVLGRMAEDGYINDAEYQRAVATPLTILQNHPIISSKTPFFSEEVRRWLLEKYGNDALYKGNLFVKTTVDPKAQEAVDRAFRHALIAYDRRHGYRGAIVHLETLDGWKDALSILAKETPLYEKQRLAVVMGVDNIKATIALHSSNASDDETKETAHSIPFSAMQWARPVMKLGYMGAAPRRASDVVKVGDVVLVSPLGESTTQWSLQQIPEVSGAMVAMKPQTGEVIAMTGGYSFTDSQFNRATQANRQPGSAFKPFVYMAGMERGFTPSTIMLDAPVELSQGAGLPPWRPQNYDGKYLGAATLRMGLEKSHNAMTVRLAQATGIKAIKSVIQRFGMYDDPPANYSVVLGSYETTLMKMVRAYAMLANGGSKVEATLVKRVDDAEGKTIYRADARSCEGCNAGAVPRDAPPALTDARERVADPRIAYQMEQLLEGVVERGTAKKAKVLGFPVAGKTGTTNDSRDAWFIGYTPDVVVGVYLGFDTPRNMGKKETGGAVALPAFIEFMQSYYDKKQPTLMQKPEGILQVKVNPYTGTPTMPWQGEWGITETFVTGAPIFVPGEEMQVAVPSEEELMPDQFVDYGNQNATAPTYGPDGRPYDPNNSTPLSLDQPSGLPASYKPSTAYSLDGAGLPISRSQANPPSTPPVNNPSLPTRPEQQFQPPTTWQNLPPRHPMRLQEERRYRGQQGTASGTGGLY
jgi:penicillin-binding protein 1A